MNLHRSASVAEWDLIPTEERKIFQKVAAVSGGILTPANVFSVLGFGLVLSGLHSVTQENYKTGFTKIAVGRLMDIADGVVAEKTGTKAPLGEKLDATIDKLEVFVTLPILVNNDVMTKKIAGIFMANHLINAAISFYASKRNIPLHVSREGKLATLAQWSTIILNGYGTHTSKNNKPTKAGWFKQSGKVASMVGIYLGARTISGYISDVHHERS